jgi:hypothetical protein
MVIVVLPIIGPIRALRASWAPWRIRNGGAIADPGETIAGEGGGAIGDGGESAGQGGGAVGDGREFAGEGGGAVGGFEYQVIATAGAFVGE